MNAFCVISCIWAEISIAFWFYEFRFIECKIELTSRFQAYDHYSIIIEHEITKNMTKSNLSDLTQKVLSAESGAKYYILLNIISVQRWRYIKLAGSIHL